MSCFVDSNVLIAYADRRDGHHDDAQRLLHQALSERAFGQAFVSDYGFDETITYTYGRSADKARALDLGRFILSSEFEFLFTGPQQFADAWTLFGKSTGLSFTDCAIASVVKHHRLDFLLSFDSGFDHLGIHRVG